MAPHVEQLAKIQSCVSSVSGPRVLEEGVIGYFSSVKMGERLASSHRTQCVRNILVLFYIFKTSK
jgi:hypothetical protein